MSKDQPKEWERDLSFIVIGVVVLIGVKSVWSSKIRPMVDQILAEIKLPNSSDPGARALGMDSTDLVGLAFLGLVVVGVIILLRNRGRQRKGKDEDANAQNEEFAD